MSEIIPPQSKPSNKRVSLDHALIVVDYYIDDKIRALNFKYGPIAELLDVRLTCCISRSLDAAIDYESAYSMACEIGLRDQAVEIVQYMIDKGILESKDGRLSKDSVIKDSEKCAKRREESAERQREKRERDEKAKIKRGCKPEFVTCDNRVTECVTPDTDTVSVYDPDHDPNPNPKEGGQGETKPTQSSIVQNKPPKIQFGEHVFLTQTEIDNVQNKHGTAFFERCCEKLNAWIEQDPTPKRRKNGKNAGATFRAWVLNAVAEEEVRASRTTMRAPPRLSNAEKTMAVYRKIEAEELAKMGMKDEEN